MTVPAGTASMVDIQNEFGGANPIMMTEYYANASTGYVTTTNYSPSSPAVPTSGAISIDNFRGKTKSSYGNVTVNQSVTTANRCDNITFAVATQYSGSWTFYFTLEWVSGSIGPTDFVGTPSGSDTFSYTAVAWHNWAVIQTEPRNAIAGVFRINIRTGSTAGPIIASSADITLRAQAFTISNFGTTVNRGDGLIPRITCTPAANITNGAQVRFYVSQMAGSVPTSDFTDNTYSNTVTFNASGYADLSPAKGLIVRSSTGTNQFKFETQSLNQMNTLTATPTATITNPTFGISTSSTNIYRGAGFTINVTTTNISNGAVLTALIVATAGTVTAADFADSLMTHSVTISSNAASVSKTAVMSWQTGTNTFQVQLKYGTTVLVTSTTATLATATINTIDFKGATSANRGTAISYRVLASNIAPGTTLYITPTGSPALATTDFVDGVINRSGAVDANSDLVVEPVLQVRTGAAKTVNYNIRHTSASGPSGGATGTGLTIPQALITGAWSPTSVNNVSSSGYTISLTNVSISTIYYTGTVTASSFCDIGGTNFASGNGTAAVPFNISPYAYSLLNAGAGDTFRFQIYSDAAKTQLFSDNTLTSVYAPPTYTLTMAIVGGATPSGPTRVNVTLTGLTAYPKSRVFAIERFWTGGSWATTGMGTVTVAANATSSSLTSVYYNAVCPTLRNGFQVRAVLAGMGTVASSYSTNLYLAM